jgi:hypothetical protein
VLSVGDRRTAYAAVVTKWISARSAPGRAVTHRFGPRNVNGVPTVLGILDERVDRACHATWFHVQLPVRPNGTTGWVRSRDVAVGVVHTRIEIDLSARTVTLFRNGRAVVRTPAAVGTGSTPTPTGRYYVNQRLRASDPNGPFGPEQLGVSAFSPVLTGWTQGGPIGIHGTNEPRLIGSAATHGCVRVPNSAIVRLFRGTLMGTPVVIHP